MIEVGPWTICEGGAGAYRARAGTTGEHIKDRVAFIEKTPRVRIRCPYLFTPDNDHLNWASSGASGDGPEDEWSRAWCDEVLPFFGYKVNDPVKADWRSMFGYTANPFQGGVHE